MPCWSSRICSRARRAALGAYPGQNCPRRLRPMPPKEGWPLAASEPCLVRRGKRQKNDARVLLTRVVLEPEQEQPHGRAAGPVHLV